MFMCLVCTNVTQVLQHLFLRSPSNVLLMMMSLTPVWSPGAPQEALETRLQIWLEIAAQEPRSPASSSSDVMTNTWPGWPGLHWSPLVSRGHSRVYHHIRRPQPRLSTRHSLWLDPFWLRQELKVSQCVSEH